MSLNQDLFDALFANDRDPNEIADLLEAGADPNAKDEGQTALQIAVDYQFSEGARIILDDPRTDVNIQNQDDLNYTALHYAVDNGDLELVQAILAKDGLNPNLGDDYGYTPLYSAIELGETEIALTILAKDGLKLNLQTIDDAYTPLHLAIYYGEEEIALEILKVDGLILTLLDGEGNTVLDLAQEGNYDDIVNAINDYGN